ncbi:MAG: transcriptional regulator [Acidobacteria bacterium SCN 69-37]|nr:MAG: transcriptional regulator [Acidobacteria bacterium SCN 69-37]
MPLYEYLCGSCGHRFERIQKFSDAPLTECPACGGHVDKQVSSPAIQFKGSGWYITDYARSGGAKDSGASSAGTSKTSSSTTSGGSASSSSEAAPAAAAPAAKSDTTK